MKAIVRHRYGSADVVEFGEVDRVRSWGAGAAVDGVLDGERAGSAVGSTAPHGDRVGPGGQVVPAHRSPAEPAAAARRLLAVPADHSVPPLGAVWTDVGKVVRAAAGSRDGSR